MLVSGSVILYGGIRTTQAGFAWYRSRKMEQKFDMLRRETDYVAWYHQNQVAALLPAIRKRMEVEVGDGEWCADDLADMLIQTRQHRSRIVRMIQKATNRVDKALKLESKVIK